MSARHLLPFIGALIAAAPAHGQLALQQVGSGFNQPLLLTYAPGDADPNRAYVVENGGVVKSFNTGTGTSSTFLDLNAIVPGEVNMGEAAGLLGMTFAPNFSNGNGFVYVNYVGNNVNSPIGGETRVDRFTVTNGVVNAGSRVNIATFEQPNFLWHKGGWIGFGPDNLMYIGMGDGGYGNDPLNLAQNPTSAMGKLLRIAPSTTEGVGGYSVPANNPFASASNDITKIVFASGLRNPFRNAFDSAGNLFIGDVGQDRREEIDFIPAGSAGGQNFGWRALEGNADNPDVDDPPPAGAVPPIYDYLHENQYWRHACVIGGYVYRGGDLVVDGQSLDGMYFFGDNVNGTVWSFRYDGMTLSDWHDWSDALQSASLFGPWNFTSFGEDAQGRLYLMDLNGNIYRLGLSSVPEPAAWVMVGVVGAAWVWRRRAVRLAD